MKTLNYAAAIALLTATGVFAPSAFVPNAFAQGMNGSTGSADQQGSAAVRSNEPANAQAMSSQNKSGQTKADDSATTQMMPQSAQMPTPCTTADSSCGKGNNPSVQSTTQGREVGASPQ